MVSNVALSINQLLEKLADYNSCLPFSHVGKETYLFQTPLRVDFALSLRRNQDDPRNRFCIADDRAC